jgi:hypothetical protein
MTEFVVAFRTHVWNAQVAVMASRLAKAAGVARFVVLADETLAPLETAPFETIAHTDDFSAFGLPKFPHRTVLWYNADYPLYLLRRQFPAASHYAMVEYDVAANIDLLQLLRHAASHGIDLIAHNIKECPTEWDWTATALKHFARPLQAFFPLLVVSGRAIDHLLARRLEIYRNKAPQAHEDWPFCEAFIPSAIAELPGVRIAGLDAYADLAWYRTTFPLHVDQPEAWTAGTVSHPVLGGTAFARKWLKYREPEDIFDPESSLRRLLAVCAPEDFVEALLRRARAQVPAVDEDRLMALATELGWPPALLARNLALGRPATQSSVCEWSAKATPEEDARGANNGQITGEAGFHTAFEPEPWWEVDLGGETAVARVVVYNRMEFRERCTRMTVSGSADGVDWVLWGAKLDGKLFGGLDGRRYMFRFSQPYRARFVRVGMIGTDFLHFDEVEIFGPYVADGPGFGQERGD